MTAPITSAARDAAPHANAGVGNGTRPPSRAACHGEAALGQRRAVDGGPEGAVDDEVGARAPPDLVAQHPSDQSRVPLEESGLAPKEIWCNESQERYVLAIAPESLARFQALADRDQVIGDLLENLSFVLDHVADRDKQLTRLIQSFRTLVGGLKKDRNAILGSLEDVSALSVETASQTPFTRFCAASV